MINDLCKQLSDDSTYTEDHILFLINKYRGALLSQYLKLKNRVPHSNYQTIQITLEPTSDNKALYVHLQSTATIPNIMPIGNPSVTADSYYTQHLSSQMPLDINLISRERMKYVGYQKYLANVMYCSINPQTQLLEAKVDNSFINFIAEHAPFNIQITAVFEDAIAASNLTNETGDLFDKEFPLDSALLPNLLQAVLKDLIGANYRPKDDVNNATDDLARLAYFIAKNAKSALAKQLDADDDTDV